VLRDDDLDRYLGLVAAGWALTSTAPAGAVPIAFLLLERRPGHGWSMLMIAVIKLLLVGALYIAVT
jgi:hypothetical protein